MVYNSGYMARLKDGSLNYENVKTDRNSTFPPFDFEVVNWQEEIRWMYRYHWIPYVTCFLYLVVIFGLQAFMKTRNPFDLRRALFCWNVAIGIFSIFGFIRMAPPFFQEMFSSGGVYSAVCYGKTRNEQTAFWLVLFVYSKFIELGDTLFIVLRKRPLVFIQWYHHGFTLIACWTVAPYVEPINTLFAILNYGVHSVMYPYYALRALKIHIPRKLANVLTTMQFGQMVIALVANLVTAGFFYAGMDCQRHPVPMKLAVTGYTAFVILFGNLWQASKKRVD